MGQTDPATPRESFPPGIVHAWLFALFNGLSYQIVLGSPMILYAKSLHASATVLGIIAGMMPTLVIFQIPAVNYIANIGYKRFVIGGWGIRTVFIFGIALVPLASTFLDHATLLALILMLLFGFNLVRGISSCAWLPWMTHLSPESLRGKYVCRDAAMSNLGSFLTILAAALCLGARPRPWQFTVIFAFSAIMGWASLIFLARVPDAPIPDAIRRSRNAVPWLAMLRHPPFQKLLRVIVAWSVAYGGMSAFVVAFLKASLGMSDEKILFLTSMTFLGGLSSLGFLGSRLDNLGSRPVLLFSFSLWLAIMAAWIGLAGGAWPASVTLVLVLEFLMGLFAALIGMAANRLAMAIIPPMGRNHFFVLYSVAANLTLGLVPVAWGLLIDAVGDQQWNWAGLSWNRYTVFFGAVAVVFFIAFALARRLDEPRAVSMEKLLTQLLIESPQRFWLRFWPRS
ncbi:MAG: MFS transporter [Verrucomicrobia bacterium]|nr:MFS transporter [Verrucomicrobiota bacterium]MDE3099734.1 MFS transporter [Verrucomicrobiota bacterium]